MLCFENIAVYNYAQWVQVLQIDQNYSLLVVLSFVLWKLIFGVRDHCWSYLFPSQALAIQHLVQEHLPIVFEDSVSKPIYFLLCRKATRGPQGS